MIRLNQLKLPVDHTREQLIHKTAQYLRIPAADILELQIVRQSLDARKKPVLFYVYTVEVEDIIWHSTAMHLSFWNGVQTWMPDRRM